MQKMEIEKVVGESADIVSSNIGELRRLFPEVYIDGRLDFETLKQILGTSVDESSEEKFGLQWPGKRRARQAALRPTMGTLRPFPKESVNWEQSENLLIEGDNLEVLKLLQKSYYAKIKLIYIDPPYNTGNDFIYPDDYTETLATYLQYTGQVDSERRKFSTNTESSGRFHSKWLSMMYPRLFLARNLLRSDGVIFISIDDHEITNLRYVCNEIFGEENFLGTIVWKGATDNNPTQVCVEHEYVICYARDASKQTEPWKNRSLDSKENILKEYQRLKKLNGQDSSQIQTELRKFIKANAEVLNPLTHYDRVDEDGPYTGSRKVHNPKPGGYVYDVPHPKTGKACVLPANGYRYPEERMKELIGKGKILFGEDENQIVQIKEYLQDYEGKLSSVIHLDSRTGSNELEQLFGERKVFTNPKPTALLKELFEFCLGPNDILLDFFAGSGSAAHAMLDMNKIDGGNRRFILVQLPEPLEKSEYATIADITKDRVRKAINKILKDSGSKSQIGFRVLKLDSSNIKAWDATQDNLSGAVMNAIEHVKSDRSEEDVLCELLLKLGIELTVPIETKTIASKKVYELGAGTLFVCLGTQLKPAEVEELALGIVKWHQELSPVGDSICVFRDSAFANDVAKTNLTAILQQHGLNIVRSL